MVRRAGNSLTLPSVSISLTVFEIKILKKKSKTATSLIFGIYCPVFAKGV